MIADELLTIIGPDGQVTANAFLALDRKTNKRAIYTSGHLIEHGKSGLPEAFERLVRNNLSPNLKLLKPEEQLVMAGSRVHLKTFTHLPDRDLAVCYDTEGIGGHGLPVEEFDPGDGHLKLLGSWRETRCEMRVAVIDRDKQRIRFQLTDDGDFLAEGMSGMALVNRGGGVVAAFGIGFGLDGLPIMLQRFGLAEKLV